MTYFKIKVKNMSATTELDCDAFCTVHASLNLAKPRRDMKVTSVTFFHSYFLSCLNIR